MICPCCNADVTLTKPAQRFRLHDRGFRGRRRREVWRDAVCRASGHTVEEAKVWAARERAGAVGGT